MWYRWHWLFVCSYVLELNWDIGRHLEEHKIALFLTETSDLLFIQEFCSQVYCGAARINTRCEGIEKEQRHSWHWSQTGRDEWTQTILRPRENRMCRATEGLKWECLEGKGWSLALRGQDDGKELATDNTVESWCRPLDITFLKMLER